MTDKLKFRAWIKSEKRYIYSDFSDFTVFREHAPEDLEIDMFTGLYDCEKNPIYEEDLLDFDEREWGETFIPERMTLDRLISEGYCGSESDIGEWRTVIGNTRQSPEIKYT